jgi:lysophospholipase L1-like esterase
MANQPNWINRGVPGNTTAQMLARFQTDVIDLHPDVVHIMGGGNDVLNETWSNGSQCGPDACENIAMMVQLAEDAGIRTVVGSPLYVGNMTEDQEIELSTMNRFLREEFTTPNQPAGSLQAGFVDYYEGGSGAATMTAMAEAEIGLVYGTPLP